jgi:small subunit ribosomal protein S1
LKQLEGDPYGNYVATHDKGNIVKGTVKSIEAKGAVITLEPDIEGYLRASEIARDRVEDVSKHLQEGQEIEAVIINIDRKNRSIQLSIKQKDAAEESEALKKHAAESSGSAGTTNLGALLKAKLGAQGKE